jgi:Mg2+ and Co2+ transporter CorA
VLTVHSERVGVLDDFEELVAGEGQIGILDAPTFLAEILEWVVASYRRAFDEIEEELEKFDLSALTTPSNRSEERIGTLVQARTRVGRLRRALSPHRELFAALSHSEFDAISTEGSAERFAELGSKVDAALASARDAKDGIASSFDVLIVRTEQQDKRDRENPHTCLDPVASRRPPCRRRRNERQLQADRVLPLRHFFWWSSSRSFSSLS